MNAIIVDSILYINKKSNIFRKWTGEYSQESELFQKLFDDLYIRFFPFTPVFYYYVYWSCVWRDREYVTTDDFYYDVIEPVQSSFSQSELRWYIREKEPKYFNNRVSKAIQLLKKEGLINTKKNGKMYRIKISRKGIYTMRTTVLETAWYTIELIDYAVRNGENDVVEKIKKVNRFRTVTPSELREYLVII